MTIWCKDILNSVYTVEPNGHSKKSKTSLWTGPPADYHINPIHFYLRLMDKNLRIMDKSDPDVYNINYFQ